MSDTQTPEPEVQHVESTFQVKEFSPELVSAVLNLAAAFRHSPCVMAVIDTLNQSAEAGDEQALSKFTEAVFHHSVMRLRSMPVEEHAKKLNEAVEEFRKNERLAASAEANILREQMTLALGTLVHLAITQPDNEAVINGNFEAFQDLIENNYRRANVASFLLSVQSALQNDFQKAFRMSPEDLEASSVPDYIKETIRNIAAEANRRESEAQANAQKNTQPEQEVEEE